MKDETEALTRVEEIDLSWQKYMWRSRCADSLYLTVRLFCGRSLFTCARCLGNASGDAAGWVGV